MLLFFSILQIKMLLNESESDEFGSSESVISEWLIDVSGLPDEVITEILVRLPKKSLFKFKCVSKSWLSFISNPHFLCSLFFSRKSCMADVSPNHVELLFATTDTTGGGGIMKKCSLYSALENSNDNIVSAANIEFQKAQKSVAIVGIINGLVCLNLKKNDLCVWNPALNKMKHLKVYPESRSRSRSGEFGEDCFFSFGYEELNDDYKVVCLETDCYFASCFDSEVSIYSLKSDSWTRIDDLKGFYLPIPGVFFPKNGNIYWSGDLFGIPKKRKILSLDMSTHKFLELQPPPKYDDDDSGHCYLWMQVSNGLLLLLCDYWEGEKLDVWVLDNNNPFGGGGEDWCKLVSIPHHHQNHHVLRNYNYQLLYILTTGEIVFGKQYGLLVYDWIKKESRSIKLDDGITTHTRIAAYVETLVWPAD